MRYIPIWISTVELEVYPEPNPTKFLEVIFDTSVFICLVDNRLPEIVHWLPEIVYLLRSEIIRCCDINLKSY